MGEKKKVGCFLNDKHFLYIYRISLAPLLIPLMYMMIMYVIFLIHKDDMCGLSKRYDGGSYGFSSILCDIPTFVV